MSSAVEPKTYSLDFGVALYANRPVAFVSVPVKDKREKLDQFGEDYFKKWPDINEGHSGRWCFSVILTGVATVGAALPCFMRYPLAEALQIVALGILTAVGYGIANDIPACRQCVEYFTNGHTKHHKRLIKTADPFKNGIVWGIFSTAPLGFIYGVGLSLAARASSYAPFSAVQILPYALGLSCITWLLAHNNARLNEVYLKRPFQKESLEIFFNRVLLPKNSASDPVDLRKVPIEKRAAWLAVGARSTISHTLMLGGGLLLMIGIIATRILRG